MLCRFYPSPSPVLMVCSHCPLTGKFQTKESEARSWNIRLEEGNSHSESTSSLTRAITGPLRNRGVYISAKLWLRSSFPQHSDHRPVRVFVASVCATEIFWTPISVPSAQTFSSETSTWTEGKGSIRCPVGSSLRILSL
jgi:hypothetical protein